jgi:uncharacterized protein (DUF1778 family)
MDRRQATKDSPSIGVRFRSKAEVDKIRRAAKREGMSFNTFVAAAAARAADEVLARSEQEEGG